MKQIVLNKVEHAEYKLAGVCHVCGEHLTDALYGKSSDLACEIDARKLCNSHFVAGALGNSNIYRYYK